MPDPHCLKVLLGLLRRVYGNEGALFIGNGKGTIYLIIFKHPALLRLPFQSPWLEVEIFPPQISAFSP